MKLLVFALAVAVCQGMVLPGPDNNSGRNGTAGPRPPPPPPDFYCQDWPDHTFIDAKKVCDGTDDCPLNWNNISADESKMRCFDKATEFPCDDKTVIALEKKCDEKNDCPLDPWQRDGDRTRDEGLWECRKPGEFICWGADKRIANSSKCDGKVDCENPWFKLGDDENYHECPPNRTEFFVCDGDTKIPAKSRCDQKNDCAGDDENDWLCNYYKNTTMNHGATNFTCWDGTTVTLDQMCDGNNDCAGPDENEWMCRMYAQEQQASKNRTGTAGGDMANMVMRKRYMDQLLDMRGIGKRHPAREM